MVYVYNRILLSYKEEHICVSFNEVDEPRACYCEVGKKEQDKYHINVYIYMELRKIALMILLEGQPRKHRHFGHSGGRRGWDDMREQH